MTVLVGLLNGMISAATPLLLSSLGGALTGYKSYRFTYTC